MKTIHYILIIISFVTLSFAQTAEEAVNLLENQDGFGVRAAALGNAYTGVADDYSAIYWNPAGLAQINNNEVSITLSHLKNSTDFTYLNQLTSDSRAFTKLDNFGLVYPFAVSRGSLVMAMGYQRIKGLDSYLNFSGNLSGPKGDSLAFDVINEYDYGFLGFDRDIAQQQSITSEGSLSQWSFGMAIDVSPRFSGGFSVSILSGGSDYISKYEQDNLKYYEVYPRYDENGALVEELSFVHYDVTQKISTEYSGLEAKAGGLFRVGEHIRLGGTITLPMTIQVTENYSSVDELAYDIYVLGNGQTYSYSGITEDPFYSDSSYTGWVLNPHNQALDLNDEGTFDYNIKVPFRFSGGLSYQNSIFLLAASAEYTDWSQLRFEMPDDRDSKLYTGLLDQNEYFSENYQPVLSWGVGGEVNLFRDALALRAGYRAVPSPFKDSALGFDRTYYTAGLGMRLDESTILEASYVYGNYKTSGNYYYAWDKYEDNDEHYEIDPMKTSEEHTSQKFLVGIKLLF